MWKGIEVLSNYMRADSNSAPCKSALGAVKNEAGVRTQTTFIHSPRGRAEILVGWWSQISQTPAAMWIPNTDILPELSKLVTWANIQPHTQILWIRVVFTCRHELDGHGWQGHWRVCSCVLEERLRRETWQLVSTILPTLALLQTVWSVSAKSRFHVVNLGHNTNP